MCVFTFWAPCCDVRYDFRIETLFGSSLPLCVGGPMYYLRYLCLLAYSGVQHKCVVFFIILCTICCQILWIVHFGLPLGYSLTFIWLYLQVHVYSSSFCVLCTLCCQFLWIVHFWLPLGYSLTFIWLYLQVHVYSSSFCVLCTLCCQFLWIVHFWLPLRSSLTFI